ncbi:MAG: hypothetical protein WA633_24200 [Stellaceae bacterium]
MLTDRAPDALGNDGHYHVGDAERREGAMLLAGRKAQRSLPISWVRQRFSQGPFAVAMTKLLRLAYIHPQEILSQKEQNDGGRRLFYRTGHP